MAFTVDKTSGDGYALPRDGQGKTFVLEKEVDFSLAANQLAQTEIMALFKIPADVLVQEVLMEVLTADTDVTDVDIGSFTTAEVAVAADGFVDGGTLASLGYVRDVSGETYSPPTGYISTGDWIVGLTNNDANAINEAKVRFLAVCLDLR